MNGPIGIMKKEIIMMFVDENTSSPTTISIMPAQTVAAVSITTLLMSVFFSMISHLLLGHLKERHKADIEGD